MTNSNPRIVILFLTADPTDSTRLRVGEELREIRVQLQMAKFRDRFDLQERLSVRSTDVVQALLDVGPQIVHFSGHGTANGELCFEDKTGQSLPVIPDALAALFEKFVDQVNCVVLNACFSELQAKAIVKHINYVIGMSQEINDQAAIAFAVGFYQALGAGRTILDAFKLGCVQIKLQGIPQHLTPTLLQRDLHSKVKDTQTLWTKPPIEFDWVTIDAGRFRVGENAQKTKYLQLYKISRTPVTNQQYQKFVADTSYKSPPHWLDNAPSLNILNHPVVNVSYNDAKAFCEWAGVRLPTEFEWEKAARGTDGRTYPWGEQSPEALLCNFANSHGTTAVDSHVCGSSPYGCVDMAGNVWEWTSSEYNIKPNKNVNKLDFGSNRSHKVLKGGSYNDIKDLLKCEARMDADPRTWSEIIGFRVVAI